MKKHQKFLVGLMILGLAGGVGTAFAMTREGANTSHSRDTDSAIYLYWGDSDTEASSTTAISELKAQTAVYRNVIVAPKASATATGTVKVTFTLAVTDSSVLTGLSVNIYDTDKYITEPGENTASATLKISETETKEYELSVSGSSTPSKYYLMEFVWDGSAIEEDKTFGGTLIISQSFKA